jgi:hypothetical protein
MLTEDGLALGNFEAAAKEIIAAACSGCAG